MQVTSTVQYTAQLLNFIMPEGDNDSKEGTTAGGPVVLNRFRVPSGHLASEYPLGFESKHLFSHYL